MAILTCRDLSLGYEGKKVVEGLTFTVESGEYLCIVGENGSGKSTLMKTILRLKAPLSGQISTGDGLKQTEIGYLPQQTVVQKDFPASVREIVLSGCLNRCGFRPYYSREEKALAEMNMGKMGIASLAKRCYRELSGGQQQRVLLARALCATRKLLLLDEPVAGLDPKVTAEMYALIEKLNRDEGITVIMISHDIAAATRYASHILHISSKPLFYGTTADYLQTPIGKAFVMMEGGAQDAR
ncbi:metal ABC transporter ATP-binding protein [Oscillibacter ruminantium]|uniref:metal ABC transporter ATP-binding protein n=1 Tax=Oscillibacter ruminantium TaxID=1263547 RepID=UPI00031C6B86|nr:ABC transporter ATP-binding protein [Oscillibacter ruminantium]